MPKRINQQPLSVTHPYVAKEWNYEKNKGLTNKYNHDLSTPDKVTAGSNIKAWWICSKGHEWRTTIINRTYGSKQCPYCSGRKAYVGFNDLATLYPELVKEWDYEKNGNLTPDKFTCGSQKKVYWKCPICNYSWLSSIVNRVRGNGCSRCSKQGTSKSEQAIAYYLAQVTSVQQRLKLYGKEVDIYLPEYNLGIEYNPWYTHQNRRDKDKEKEVWLTEHGVKLISVIGLDGDAFSKTSGNSIENNSVFFVDDRVYDSNFVQAIRDLCALLSKTTGNDKFNNIDVDLKRDSIKIRERFSLGQKEKSLATMFPDIATEWDYEKNGDLKPEQVQYGSPDLVWWKCLTCKNSWQERVNNRTGHYKLGCPYCSNHRVVSGKNDLATMRPDLAAEWDYDKNKNLKDKKGRDISTPDKVSAISNQRVFWICSSCGYNWHSSICNRSSNGKGCPICGRKSQIEKASKPQLGINDLVTKFPDIAKEWDYEKNNPLTPEQVAYSSNKKAWWICSTCGYNWETTINNRSQGKGCRICGKEKSRIAKYKPVMCIETSIIYSSISEAELKTGIRRTSIGHCCNGKQKTAGGYHWKYVD